MKKVGRIFLYALVPILTVSVEDSFLLLRLEGKGRAFLFRDFLLFEPILGVLVLTIALAFLSSSLRFHRIIVQFNVLLVSALFLGIMVGLFGKRSLSTTFFEFQYWRSLVFFSVLVILMVNIWGDINGATRYIRWFVLVQSLYAAYVLIRFLAFGDGQSSNFGRLVPIFAGDQLAFMAVAQFVLSARNSQKPTWVSVLQQIVFSLILLLSLRRTMLAAAVFSIGSTMLLSGLRKKMQTKILYAASILLILVTFFGVLVNLTSLDLSLVKYRFETINPFAVHKYGRDTTSGHNDDFLDGWDLVKESPILGKGLNSYFPLRRTGEWQGDSHLHSTMFSMWVKLGLPGLLFYLFAVTYGLRFFFGRSALSSPGVKQLANFVITFSAFNFMASAYLNGIFLGSYKMAVCLAMYMAVCVLLVKHSQNAERKPVIARSGKSIGPAMRSSGFGSSRVEP